MSGTNEKIIEHVRLYQPVTKLEIARGLYGPSRQRGQDLGNLAKPVLDVLFNCRAGRGALFDCDDCFVNELVLRKVVAESIGNQGADIEVRW